MIFQYRELCWKLFACFTYARQQLKDFASVAPTSNVDTQIINIFKDYFNSTPDNLASNQTSSLKDLIFAVFSAHLNIVQECEVQIQSILQPFSSITIEKVLPNHRINQQKVKEISNWIANNIHRTNNDHSFISTFIANSDIYLDQFGSKIQELKSIYDIVSSVLEELKDTEKKLQERLKKS